MTLTMTDLEAALQDRTAELRELEDQRSSMEHELHSARRSERTREVVGRVFADFSPSCAATRVENQA